MNSLGITRIFLLLMATLVAGAAMGENCPVDATDPFAMTEVVPSGPFKGHCVDNTQFRYVHKLTDDEAQQFGLKPDPSTAIIGNFLDEGRYWVAVIPYERVESLIFQGIPILNVFYHGQLRFHLNQGPRPIRLIEQTTSSERETKILKEDIVFSLLTITASDDEHKDDLDFLRASAGLYTSAYVFGSVTDITSEDREAHNPIHQWSMRVSTQQAVEALKVAIDMGTEKKVSEMYSVAFDNCLTAVFDVLKKVLGIGEGSLLMKADESLEPIRKLKLMKLLLKHNGSRIEDYTGEPGAKPATTDSDDLSDAPSDQSPQ